MIKRKLNIASALAVLLLATGTVMAEPSVNADTNQSVESSDSSNLTREKKLSVEKSTSNRMANSKSHEASAEKSRERSNSERTSKDSKSSKSFVQEYNLNGLLLSRFVQHYEVEGKGGDILDFKRCKPITRAVPDYPTLGFEEGQLAQVTREVANNNRWQPNVNGRVLPAQIDGFKTGRYIGCRILASLWLTKAASYIAQTPVRDVEELTKRIDKTFDAMDADLHLINWTSSDANHLYPTYCSPFLRPANEFKGGEIECGTFAYRGDKFYVNNQETLSEAAIGGMSFKVSLSNEDSSSRSAENTSSESRRVSNSSRTTVSAESADENRSGSSMAKTKSSNSTSNASNNMSAGSGIKGVKQ